MKSLVSAAVLALAALWATAASAQVYGADDDPYAQNPFASNMSLPDTSQTSSTPASGTAAPPAQQQDTGRAQQQTAASSSQGAKPPAQP